MCVRVLFIRQHASFWNIWYVRGHSSVIASVWFNCVAFVPGQRLSNFWHCFKKLVPYISTIPKNKTYGGNVLYQCKQWYKVNMRVFFHRHIWHKHDLLKLWIIYVRIYLFIRSSFICSLFNETISISKLYNIQQFYDHT